MVSTREAERIAGIGVAARDQDHAVSESPGDQDDPRPLDEACACPACRGYSRAYLHHVFRAGEIIAAMLLTWHNLHYYQELMAGLRTAIAAGRLADFVAEFEAARAGGDVPAAG